MNSRTIIEKTIQGRPFHFLPEKVVVRPDISQLIVADLHIGKSTIFRSNGLPLPLNGVHKDLGLLTELIKKFDIKELLILGDLFHGPHNKEHQMFGNWLQEQISLKCMLTTGNHDRYDFDFFKTYGAQIHAIEHLEEDGFSFSHETKNTKCFQFLGHIHPKYHLRGKGALRHTGPCFYLSSEDKMCILPSFCSNSGGHLVKKKHKSDEILLIAGSEIIPC